MVIKGGIRGQPGNPLDPADEGVFCVRVNPGGAAAKDPRIKVGREEGIYIYVQCTLYTAVF